MKRRTQSEQISSALPSQAEVGAGLEHFRLGPRPDPGTRPSAGRRESCSNTAQQSRWRASRNFRPSGGLLDRSAGAKERSVRPSQAWEEGMSWHTSALVIEGDHARRGPDLFEDLGFPGLAEVSEVSGDEAGRSALQGRALGLVRGWTFVWDPMMFLGNGDQVVGFDASIFSGTLPGGGHLGSRQSRIQVDIA